MYSKLYQLSNGMKQRISFSITVNCVKHVDPDIILLDEVFSGRGDEEFKEKSNKKIKELLNGRRTLLMVSHNMNLIKDMCATSIWVDQGKIVDRGPTKEIIQAYLSFIKRKKSREE